MTLRTLTLSAALTLGALLTGCSSNADSICDKRKECFTSNLDTGECAENIDEWVEDGDEDDRRDRVEECAQCLDDTACSEVLGRCIDDCFDVPS
ncbi:hypothetical protein ACLESO_28795 [Pyxidicoccus sp. 3LG]